MVWAHYAKVTTLYFIGVAVVIFGLYIFLTGELYSQTESFYFMSAGLAVSGVGSRYGHKHLRDPRFQKKAEQIRKEAEKKRKQEEKDKDAKRKEEEKVRKEQEKQSEKEAIKVQEKKEPEPERGTKVVKIVICPDCGEENKYTAKFCDNCGRKLRP